MFIIFRFSPRAIFKILIQVYTLVSIHFNEHEVLIKHLCFPQRDLFYPVRNWELDSVSETFFGFLSQTFRQKNHSRKKSVKIADATMQKGRTTQH